MSHVLNMPNVLNVHIPSHHNVAKLSVGRQLAMHQANHFGSHPKNARNASINAAITQSRRSLVIVASSENGNGNGVDLRPKGSETARTIVDLAAHGTLCTTGDDSIPLGTYASYVLDSEGQPILRLRSDAVHTINLTKNPKCSLFVQPADHPARLLARVTLIGQVEPVSAELAASAAELHATLHAGGVGVDAPRPDDLYYRLVVERGFYVGQLSGESQAEVIPGDEYRNAEADPLRAFATELTKHMNEERQEDVLRIGCRGLNKSFEDMYFAELLWVDRLGAYVRGVGQDGTDETVRVPFTREVVDERDVRSALTMMAQVAWEKERTYVPVAVPIEITAE